MNDYAEEHRRNLENRIRGLEDSMAQVMPWRDRVDADLYNHGGRDGLKSQFTIFITEYRATEKEREQSRRERDAEIKAALEEANESLSRKVALVGTIVAILALLVAYLTLLQTGNVKSGVLPKISSASRDISGAALAARGRRVAPR